MNLSKNRLSIDEAAAALKVTRRTIYRLIAKGEIDQAGRGRVTSSSIQDHMSQGKARVTPDLTKSHVSPGNPDLTKTYV